MVMPGDNLKFTVELIAPIAMEEKLRFAIREGGRTDKTFCKPNLIIQSIRAKNTAAKADNAKTITVVSKTSLRVGQVILDTSDLTC